MKPLFTFALIAALAPVAQAAPKFGEMKMTGPNSAKIIYEDKCANGGNIDKEKEVAFVNAMLANPSSNLGKLKAKLLKEIGDDIRGEGVYVSEPVDSYHDRDGCGQSWNSFSVFVYTLSGGNTDHTVARFLVSVDDDDNSGVRTLKLRSIQKIAIRN